MHFKAIEPRKPPEDQNRPPEETFMGAAVIVWNRTQVTARRHVSWSSSPIAVSDQMVNVMFDPLPRECHVDLILETLEVMFAVKACADIITMGLDGQIYCQLEEWRRLMNIWKDHRVQMTVREPKRREMTRIASSTG
jgi:hypothetical protein